MSRSILVVDDDQQMVKTFCDILRVRGWDAAGAHSGEEALEVVRRREFSVVLMDIRMPGIDGVETLREMRAHRPGIRVLLMTAYTASDLLEEAEREGAVRILSKPVAIPDLLGVLDASALETVLIVDDDPDFLTTLAGVLRSRGYPTLGAGSLDEALARMEESSPGVVLLDLRLDSLEPRQGILAIRRMDPAVVLILLSGYPGLLRQTAEAVPPHWIRGALEKPFSPDRLLELIDGIDEG